MIKTLLLLCFEFFKTGLFAVGGGLATLPFLNDIAEKYPEWFTHEQLADMIAVAESTPGPIGINMATYAGFTAAGVPGALLATFSLVLPAFLILLMIAKALDLYMSNRFVKAAFKGLRPAVTGLIAAAGFGVYKLCLLDIEVFDGSVSSIPQIFNWVPILIFAVVLFLTQFKYTKKLHPVILIAACAAVGVLLKL